jgi:hypothetical protein
MTIVDPVLLRHHLTMTVDHAEVVARGVRSENNWRQSDQVTLENLPLRRVCSRDTGSLPIAVASPKPTLSTLDYSTKVVYFVSVLREGL